MRRIADNPKIKPVLMTFRPPLAWRLNATAQQKRSWAAYYRFRNYKERCGSPMRHFVPEAFNIDMAALRWRIAELEQKEVWLALHSLDSALLNFGGQLAALTSLEGGVR